MNNFQNPYYPQYQQNPYQTQKNGITWVQGIEGAKAFQLAPNSNVMLLDSESDGRFYIKTSDNIGMCNLRIFKYVEITDTPKTESTIDMSQYVTRNELAEILNSLKGETVNEQSVQPTKRRNLITE